MSSDEEAPPTPSSEDEAPTTERSEGEPPTTSINEKEVTKEPRTVPRSDWQFAFGPQKWYWIRTGTAWRATLPQTCVWDEVGIRNPVWMAFMHTTGFFVGGKDEEGQPQVIHNWNDGYQLRANEVDNFVISREAYKRLHDWVDQKQLKDTSVSIGPKGSYFARCGESWISHGLPKDLMTKLDRNKEKFTPIQVALGLHGSWIVLWSDGDLSYDLRSSYHGLGESDALTGAVGQVLFVALNPYEENGYFVAGKDGCSFNANLSSKKDGYEIQKMMDDYMRMKAKRDNATFNYPVMMNGVRQNVHITPNTYERRRADSLLDTWKQRRGLLLQRDNLALIGAGSTAAYVLSRCSEASPLRATGAAAATGVGITAIMLSGICQGPFSSW
ncbi:hypothetical protein P171DRAFT_526079 [Karstenula rhodostoma CBS 690.94]|uniref:Uncharacterized protein n=1 Tax=Karstenula rhodostoma CBS 690.94 TaxID=1392251 RepID=A0A9P4U5T6_9PLEO|nr:hypothetical protein P171DRAFT_526079 [Karstenula rhodostoma CBS 690.94]